jgi:Na+-translocating ferredoxin:NAD+ oxidoreductase RnfG subunit
MAKKESTLGTMILSLLLITAAASAALVGVYKMTEKSIIEVQNQKKQQAIQAVLHDFNGDL